MSQNQGTYVSPIFVRLIGLVAFEIRFVTVCTMGVVLTFWELVCCKAFVPRPLKAVHGIYSRKSAPGPAPTCKPLSRHA